MMSALPGTIPLCLLSHCIISFYSQKCPGRENKLNGFLSHRYIVSTSFQNLALTA